MKLFILSFLVLCPRAFAEEARITYVLGDVEVRSAPGEPARKASAGLAVPPSGEITTRARSLAVVGLPDGSVIKVGRESHVALTEFSAAGSTLVSLLSGSVFAKAQKQEGKRRFRVLTKTASMGVRGTQFFTAIREGEHGASDVWMCVKEGKVAVEGVGDGKTVLVGAGQGVRVPAGKPVTPPKEYAWTKRLNWNMDPQAGEVIDDTPAPSYRDLLDQHYD